MNQAGHFGSPVSLTASGVVKSASGVLFGFMPTATGTLNLYDGANTSGTGLLAAAIPVTAGVFVTFPLAFATGLYAVLASGAQGTFVVA